MAPTPQEYSIPDEVIPGSDGERVVISGMSGLYPQSRHVQDLSHILYNKVNPITDKNCRWQYNHPEVSNHTGKIPNLDRFDAQFFKVNFRMCDSMDSMSRKILEQAYQAIYDAGISPEQLSGKKVGVYTGTCFSETEKDLNRYKSSIPRLVTISGRQDSSVQLILDDLKSRPVDPEELALFHNIHQSRISGHLGRGYTILATNEEQKTVSLAEEASYFDDAKRPLWFVYSGMGSQWAGMGTQLMRIPIFAAAIERCRKVLEPKGLDIIHIITSPEKTIFDNILNSFVGIAAIQIGLTDILTALGLVPDNIIGHSVGELGCAYADGCFTAEEMILAAYSRGLVSVQTPFIRGSMAAVGIGYQQVVKMLPPEIEVACHNGPESSTISGPADIMREFVGKLTAQGIFAKEVPCSNIAYHSRYIAGAGPGLLQYLSEVIKDPKPRSERWVSSSVPKDKWNEPAAKYCSAQYHTNNLLNPVLFEETCHHIPENAVLVEIAPYGLLQAILKRSLSQACRNIPLTRREHPDNAFVLLEAVGKLFMEGYNPKIQAIYPKVEFPVSTGTPMLSHLVEWAHEEKWSLPLYVLARWKMAAACKFVISLHDDEHSYIQGNVIRGKILYPFTAALVAAWDTLAMSLLQTRRKLTVEFHDVHLFAQPTLHDQRNLRLSVSLHRGTGWFEIMDGSSKVATGYIVSKTHVKRTIEQESNEEMTLSSEDFYQLMFERDYFYSGEFRSIRKANPSLTEAEIVWNNNWVTFLDGLLQLNVLRHAHDTVSHPSQIRRLCIDIKEHLNYMKIQANGSTVMRAEFIESREMTRCGGVTIQNVMFHNLPRISEDAIAMKTLKFIPRFRSNVDMKTALQSYLQMVAENIDKETIIVLRITNKDEDSIGFNEMSRTFADIPGITVHYKQIEKEKVLEMRNHFLTDVDLILVQNLSSDDTLCQMLYRVLQRDMFLVNAEESADDCMRPSALYRLVSCYNVSHRKLELLRWRPTQISAASTVVTVRIRSDLALLSATRNSLPQRNKMIILSSFPPVSGLKELVKQWRKESDRNQIYLVMISDNDNLDQLPELDLAFNILENGVWGGEYYVPWQERMTVERGVTLRIKRPGDLESLQWVEAPEPKESGVPVTVHYAAINDYDVKKATCVIPMDGDSTFAMDFSGITDSGERVMGIVSSGAASGRVKVRPELVWPVPAHWSLEDAATVPSAYAHAFYCYTMKARFIPGQSVLIHGAAGALGQALVAIGLALGYKVYATVSNSSKKKFLMRLFPELRENHIGNSRDPSFGDMVRNVIDGKGVDIVICCVKKELKNVSLTVCGQYGMTLDVAQFTNKEPFSLGMNYLTCERSYVTVDFNSIFSKDNVDEMKLIQMQISEGIGRGYVRPLSRVTYAPHEVSRAFRLLAASRHRGRVVLRLRDSIQAVQPRISCSPDLNHLLLCDGDAFGLQLADRLVIRGARKLHLHCSNVSTRLQLKIKLWKKLDVKVQVSSEDLSDTKGVLTLLNNSNRLGSIEGVYVIATSSSVKTADKLESVVSNLDLMSRKLYPSIRYFVVVNADSTIGQNTCLSRVRDGLPATMLSIPELKKVSDKEEDAGFSRSPNPLIGSGVGLDFLVLNNSMVGNTVISNEALSWRTAVDATERALRSSQPALLAHAQKLSPPSLLKQIAAIAGIHVPDETGNNSTLLDMDMELANVPAISSFLQDIHNISIPVEQIPTLTVEQIHELEETILGVELKEVRGLGTFFSYVDPDELLATTDMVFLPSLTNSAIMQDDEVDVSQTYLCIVPGLEGHHERFRELCERLKLAVMVLQPGLDRRDETPRETAERFVKVFLKNTLKKTFYLLGYENGINVTLEMAAILEDLGLTGTVFCIGGMPEEIKSTITEQLCEFETDEALQDAVIRHMFRLMTGNTQGLDQVLQNVSTWREKIDTCVRMLLGRVAHSAQYVRALIEAAYMRIKQAQIYKSDARQLRSRLILLHASSSSRRTSSSHGMSTEMLQRYSQQPVIVEELRLPLAHAARDMRCAAIINRYLSKEVLEEYEKRNYCETYVLQKESFKMYSEENS